MADTLFSQLVNSAAEPGIGVAQPRLHVLNEPCEGMHGSFMRGARDDVSEPEAARTTSFSCFARLYIGLK